MVPAAIGCMLCRASLIVSRLPVPEMGKARLAGALLPIVLPNCQRSGAPLCPVDIPYLADEQLSPLHACNDVVAAHKFCLGQAERVEFLFL